jgi:hypothetical protein
VRLQVEVLTLAVVLAACRSHEPTPAPASSITSSAQPLPVAAPKWLTRAERAPPSLAKDARDVRLDPRDFPSNAAAIDAVLDDVAAQDASGAGIRAAAGILSGAPPKLNDPRWAGGGGSPRWAIWLHYGGIALLADLAQRACAAHAHDASVLEAIDAIELPPITNSGGIARAQMNEARAHLRGAAAACH